MGSKHDTTRRRGDVNGGEVALRSEKGGDDASWADANFIWPKIKENPHGRFNCYKWTMKI
jgi:hypothetical protein